MPPQEVLFFLTVLKVIFCREIIILCAIFDQTMIELDLEPARGGKVIPNATGR